MQMFFWHSLIICNFLVYSTYIVYYIIFYYVYIFYILYIRAAACNKSRHLWRTL